MVFKRLEKAIQKFKEFNTAELTSEVRMKNPDKEKMINEACDVAAMAIRFIYDLCGEGYDGTGRR